MVPLRLYMDEDSMDQDLVRALRARNVDVATALDAGMTGRSDNENFDHASAEGRVLYTFNAGDFYRLHSERLQEGRPHAGLIIAPQQRYSVGEQMRRLLRLIATRSANEMVGRVEFLGAWG